MSALTQTSLVRIFLLVVLMAGVLMQPVLALGGDLHEAGHAVAAVDHDHHGDDAPEPIDPSDARNPWHALMHSGQCCGHTAAVMPLGLIGLHLPTANVPLPAWSVALKPATHPVALRPPISI